MEKIGDRIRRLRKEAGLSQAALAKLAGISQAVIGNAESGYRERPRDLLSLAMALGVDPYYLETGKSSQGPEALNSPQGRDTQPRISPPAQSLINDIKSMDINGTLAPDIVSGLRQVLHAIEKANFQHKTTPTNNNKLLDTFEAEAHDEDMPTPHRNTLWKHGGISTVDSSDILPVVPDLEDTTPSYQVAQLSELLSPEDFLEPPPMPRKKKTPRTTKG